jgi:hypothetical protein
MCSFVSSFRVSFTVLCLFLSTHSLLPSRLFITTTIDISNEEIVREGLRLIQSIRSFAGEMNDAFLEVGVVYQERDSLLEQNVVKSLNHLNVSIRYCQSVQRPRYSPTLNKFCSFHDIPAEKYDYFLYIDADMFIVYNPVPLFSSVLLQLTEQGKPYDIYCGRAWNALTEMNYFPALIDYYNITGYNFTDENAFASTISPGGTTFQKACNTGLYFMPTKQSNRMSQYIHSHILPTYQGFYNKTLIPLYDEGNYMVDSFVLWVAQYALHLDTFILPIQFNYLVAVEDYILSHPLHLINMFPVPITTLDSTKGLFYFYIEWKGDMYPMLFPAIFHFSRGSDLHFICEVSIFDRTRNWWEEPQCKIQEQVTSRKFVSCNITVEGRFFEPADHLRHTYLVKDSLVISYVYNSQAGNSEYCNNFCSLLDSFD